MKTAALIITLIFCSAFSPIPNSDLINNTPVEEATMVASIKLINDTGKKVSIHTGSGFVSLNKGGSTSITCNKGKEVRWADSGKKGAVIFKIGSEHCGKTLKLSKL